MKEQLKNCYPTIVNKSILMTGGNEFMNKELIKEKCIECTKQEVCIRIVDLLNAHKIDDALDLMKYVGKET